MQRNHLKEIKRFPGYFLGWRKLSRTQVITIEGERIVIEKGPLEEGNECEYAYMFEDDYGYGPKVRFCIWDVISGQSVQNFNLQVWAERILSFNSERKEVITLNNKRVQKYDIASDSWIKLPSKICNSVTSFDLFAKNSSMPLLGAYQTITILRNLTIGKSIFDQRQRITSCKLSLNKKQKAVGTSSGVIYISDLVRGCIIKSLIDRNENIDTKANDDCSFSADGKHMLAITGKKFILQDIADSKLANLSITSKISDSCIYCLCPDGQKIAIVDEAHTISFIKFPMAAEFSIQTPTIRGNNNKGLNLQGVIANRNANLSEENIDFLQEKGDYGKFNETMIKNLFSTNSTYLEDVREIIIIGKELAPIHGRIIASDLHWINLRRLDLSKNNLGEESGQEIGSIMAWANLEELILIQTEIGDVTAKSIANNQHFQKLKELKLASNKIGNFGAEAIGNNKIWMNLEVLNLFQNEIEDEGALAIGTNNIWKKLVTLDLSSNQLRGKDTLVFLCSNTCKAWEHLQFLLLGDNPIIFQTNDVYEMLEKIVSKTLKELTLLQARFNQDFLNLLKYSAPENLIDLSLAGRRYDDMNAEIIGANTTWTNLKKIDLSKNFISDKGGIKIGSNTSWINLEVLNLCQNEIKDEGALAIGKNNIWNKLLTLDLSSNRLRSKDTLVFLCSNKAWEHLEFLFLGDNPVIFPKSDLYEMLEKIVSKSLKELTLPQARFNQDFLNLLKYSAPENFIDLSLAGRGYSNMDAEIIGANATWTNLKKLELQHNCIGSEGAAALGQNQSWIKLQTLNLEKNSIDCLGAAELSLNAAWINLKTLNLRYNSISAFGATYLGRNSSWINLETLILSNNRIGNDGAEELSKNTSWINLKTLILRNNQIGDDGVANLSRRNVSWINLETLILRNNRIGVTGAAELRKNNTWINLRILDLANNWIKDEGAEYLSKNTSWIRLQTLNLTNTQTGRYGETKLRSNATWPGTINIIIEE